MNRHTTFPDPIEPQSFGELVARYPDVPGAGRAQIFDTYGPRARAACWAGVRRYSDGQFELDNTEAGRLSEPYCAACRDRTVAHEPGECQRHQLSRRSTAATRQNPGAVTFSSGDALKRIAPTEYVEAFTGDTVSPGGKIRCPLHDERTPSFHVYEDHWWCFGCNTGGGVYELASRITGLGTSGRDFLELRRWVASAVREHRSVWR